MSELIHKLGIDWKLLVAQVVNFLVLLFLLKKFLYKPVLELLAKRRAAIAESIANTERIAQELKSIESRKIAEVEKAKKEADVIIEQARIAAKARGEELFNEAEKRVEKLIKDAGQRIEEDRANMMADVAGEVKELVFLATEKVLRERLPVSANERFVEGAIAAVKHGQERNIFSVRP